LLDEWRGPTTTPRVLSFSPSGQRLACGAKDQSAWVWEPASLRTDAAAQASADGWEDLLGPLKRDEVAKDGHGWSLNSGALVSSPFTAGVVALPGKFAGTSYELRLKLRALTDHTTFHIVLPVGDQTTGFDLDATDHEEFYTGLDLAKGKWGKELPGVLKGRQVQDSEKHDLTVKVQLDDAKATISSELDGQPLYTWTGPVAYLRQAPYWTKIPDGVLGLGSNSADWVIYEVKAKGGGKE